MAVQEAVPIEDSPHLRHIFGPEILGRLPKAGDDRVRRTALHLIGTFARTVVFVLLLTTLLRQLRVVVYDAALTNTRVGCLLAAHECDHLCRVCIDRPTSLPLRCERLTRSV